MLRDGSLRNSQMCWLQLGPSAVLHVHHPTAARARASPHVIPGFIYVADNQGASRQCAWRGERSLRSRQEGGTVSAVAAERQRRVAENVCRLSIVELVRARGRRVVRPPSAAHD